MQIKLNWIFLRIIPPHLKTINMKSDRVNVNCMFSILCTNHIHSCVCHVLKLLNLQRNDKHCIYCLWSRCLVFRSETENVWGIKPVRKVHLRFSIIQFLLVILVLMAFFFLVRSLVNLTLVSESLNKDRKYSGSFYQLEKKYDRSNTSQCKTQLFHFICLVFLFIWITTLLIIIIIIICYWFSFIWLY